LVVPDVLIDAVTASHTVCQSTPSRRATEATDALSR
jgi:hypothetical protein